MTRRAVFAVLVLVAGVLATAWSWPVSDVAPVAPALPFAGSSQAGDAGALAAPPAPELEPRRVAAVTTALAAGTDELAAHEQAAFTRVLDPNELEVRVLHGRTPVAGARVRVWRGTDLRMSPSGEPLREGVTGPDGAVRFDGMQSGVHVVRADRDVDHASTYGIVRGEGLQADLPRTALLLFGTAAIEGTVLDAEGRPRAGIPVAVTGGGRWSQRRASAVTDAGGRFRIGSLYGGSYSVQGIEPRQCTLPPGGTAQLAFGGPVPPGVVIGRIVDAHGGAVAGPRRLRLRDAVRHDERQVRSDLDGTFRVPLPPGTWQVLPGLPARDDVLATVVVGDRETRCEVCWPGVRLVAVLGQESDLPLGVLRGGLTLRGNAGRLESDGFVVEGRGHVQWLDVAPGDYRLQVSGASFADSGAQEILLRVTADPVQRVVVNLAGR